MDDAGGLAGRESVLALPAVGWGTVVIQGFRPLPNGKRGVIIHLAASADHRKFLAEVLSFDSSGRGMRGNYWVDAKMRVIKGANEPESREQIQLSSDGMYMAFTSSNPDTHSGPPRLQIVDLDSGERKAVGDSAELGWDRNPRWHPSKHRLLYTHVIIQRRRAINEVREYCFTSYNSRTLIHGELSVLDAAYAENDETIALNQGGLVAVGLDGKVRTILQPERLKDLTYQGAGIAWRPKAKLIALTFKSRSGDTVFLRCSRDGLRVKTTSLGARWIVSLSALSGP